MRKDVRSLFFAIPFLVLFFLFISIQSQGSQAVKHPNVSGQFYPSSPKELSAQIDGFLKGAKTKPYETRVDVLIVPHAGYVYSGAVAAEGFRAVSKNVYQTVVIIAASHHFPFNGISVWNSGGFQTPLGTAPVDEAFARQLLEAGGGSVKFVPDVFEKEHSLEVEIPFVQKVFPDAKIVPVLVGQPGYEDLESFAQTLKDTVKDRNDVLVIASTDMSHFYEDSEARRKDKKTLEILKEFNAEKFFEGCQSREIEMCGFMPVTISLLYVRKKGLDRIDVLKYANSGDVTGDIYRVVGYSAIVISGNVPLPEGKVEQEAKDALNDEQKQRLLKIARQTMEEYIQSGRIPEIKEKDPRLHKEEGAFVTIYKHGRLRGCIGNIIARGPLFETVRNMAIACSTQDPRFPKVRPEELKDLHIDISVLSVPRKVQSADEIILGRHGVIVSQGFHQGVFLPQVAESTGWTKEQFLSELCNQKAGLPADCWKDPATTLEVFTADVFAEKDLSSK